LSRVKLEITLIEQDGFRLTTGRFQHEIGSVLPECLSCPVDDGALFSIRPKIYHHVSKRGSGSSHITSIALNFNLFFGRMPLKPAHNM
jgi:hypothetical protein